MNLSPDSIYNSLNSIISDMNDHRWLYTSRPQDFSRNRKITFSDLVYFVLSKSKNPSKVELLDFFNYKENAPSSSAMIQQRSKVPYTAFETIFHRFNQQIKVENTIKGYDPIAIDGSSIHIPRNPEDPETYRVTDPYGKGCNLIHLVAGFHLLNQVYTNAVIQPAKFENEYNAMCSIIDQYTGENPDKKPLFIADRGFSSFNVFAHAIENNAFFLIRSKNSTSTPVCKFLASLNLLNTADTDITFERWITRRRTRTIVSQPEIYQSIRNKPFDYLELNSKKLHYIGFRAVQIQLKNGETEILLTNLPREDFSIEELKDLYNMRWGIETSFRDAKYTASLAYFHSKKKNLILQEIFAKLILYNFCRLIGLSAAIKKETEKYTYKINFTLALAICVDFLLHYSKEKAEKVPRLLSKEMIPMRENRSSPRYIKARTAFSFQYR